MISRALSAAMPCGASAKELWKRLAQNGLVAGCQAREIWRGKEMRNEWKSEIARKGKIIVDPFFTKNPFPQIFITAGDFICPLRSADPMLFYLSLLWRFWGACL